MTKITLPDGCDTDEFRFFRPIFLLHPRIPSQLNAERLETRIDAGSEGGSR